MILEKIASLLEDAGLGKVGQDIFVHRMGPDVAKGIMLRLPPEGIKDNHYIPGYYNTEFQAIVRASKQADGDQLASEIRKALTLYNREFVEGDKMVMRIKQSLPKNLPIIYPRSDGAGIEWSVWFCIALDLYRE